METSLLFTVLIFLPLGKACEYRFREEPVTNLSCNPYHNDELQTECIVISPRSMSVDIKWFRNEGTILTNNDDGIEIEPQIQPSSGTITTRSRLTLTSLSNQVGTYWCQVRLANGTLLEESNRLTLSEEATYTSFNNCISTMTSEDVFSAPTDRCIFPLPVVTGDTPPPTTGGQTTSSPIITITPPDLTEPPPNPSELTYPPTSVLTTDPQNSDNLSSALYAVITVILVLVTVIVTVPVTLSIVFVCRRKCEKVDFKTTGHIRPSSEQNSRRHTGDSVQPWIEEYEIGSIHSREVTPPPDLESQSSHRRQEYAQLDCSKLEPKGEYARVGVKSTHGDPESAMPPLQGDLEPPQSQNRQVYSQLDCSKLEPKGEYARVTVKGTHSSVT